MTTFNDIFKSSFLENVSSFSVIDMLVGMIFACAVGLFIFVIYKKTFIGVMYSPSLGVSLVGLSLITTLVIMAVSSNVVLSLGMVGALSIVRFRAAIKEPMEIVFLFWSLASGIVIGAGMIPLAVLGSVIIGLILLVLANHKSKEEPYILVISSHNEESERHIINMIENDCKNYSVKTKTVRADLIELSIEVRMKDADTSFVNKLQNIDGVDSAVLVSYNGNYMS